MEDVTVIIHPNPPVNVNVHVHQGQSISEKGQPNGYASLDATGKVPIAQLPELEGGGGGGPTAFAALTGAPSDNTALSAALAGKASAADLAALVEAKANVSDLAAKQSASEKGEINGYAALDAQGRVPLSQGGTGGFSAASARAALSVPSRDQFEILEETVNGKQDTLAGTADVPGLDTALAAKAFSADVSTAITSLENSKMGYPTETPPASANRLGCLFYEGLSKEALRLVNPVAGSLLYNSSIGGGFRVPAWRAPGTNGYFLKMVAGLPEWQAIGTGDISGLDTALADKQTRGGAGIVNHLQKLDADGNLVDSRISDDGVNLTLVTFEGAGTVSVVADSLNGPKAELLAGSGRQLRLSQGPGVATDLETDADGNLDIRPEDNGEPGMVKVHGVPVSLEGHTHENPSPYPPNASVLSMQFTPATQQMFGGWNTSSGSGAGYGYGTLAGTNAKTRMRRLNMSTSNTTTPGQWWASAEATLFAGHFKATYFFAVFEDPAVAGARKFIGPTSSTGSLSNAEATTFPNAVGVAQISIDGANWHAVWNGQSQQLAVPILGTSVYRLVIESFDGTGIKIAMTDMATGAHDGISANDGPAHATALHWRTWICNNGQSGTYGLSSGDLFMEARYG